MQLKGNVHTIPVRSALLHGADTWVSTRGQEPRLEVNATRMLIRMCGLKSRDHIRIKHLRGTTRVTQASKKIAEKRLKYGHVGRIKQEHRVRRMLVVEIPGKRRRWKDAHRSATTQAGGTERMTGEARDKEGW